MFSCCQSWPLHHRHTGAIFRAPPDTQVRFSGRFLFQAIEAARYDFPAGSRLAGTIFRRLYVHRCRSHQVRFSSRLQTHMYDFRRLYVPRCRSPQVRFSGRLQTHRYDFPGASCSRVQKLPGTIFQAAADSQVRFSVRFLLQATEASRYDFPGGSRHTGTMFRALRVPGYRSPRYDFPGGSRLTSAIFRGLRVPGYRSPQVRFSGRLQTHRYDFPGASSPQV